jgi:hypothetical protein
MIFLQILCHVKGFFRKNYVLWIISHFVDKKTHSLAAGGLADGKPKTAKNHCCLNKIPLPAWTFSR